MAYDLNTLLSELKSGEVIVNIGQPWLKEQSPLRRTLDRMVRRGELAKWRGKWFPVTGAPYGLGPRQNMLGSAASQGFAMSRMTIADWKRRRDRCIEQRKSSAFAQRQLELAVARQIRAELREERKARKMS